MENTAGLAPSSELSKDAGLNVGILIMGNHYHRPYSFLPTLTTHREAQNLNSGSHVILSQQSLHKCGRIAESGEEDIEETEVVTTALYRLQQLPISQDEKCYMRACVCIPRIP